MREMVKEGWEDLFLEPVVCAIAGRSEREFRETRIVVTFDDQRLVWQIRAWGIRERRGTITHLCAVDGAKVAKGSVRSLSGAQQRSHRLRKQRVSCPLDSGICDTTG